MTGTAYCWHNGLLAIRLLEWHMLFGRLSAHALSLEFLDKHLPSQKPASATLHSRRAERSLIVII